MKDDEYLTHESMLEIAEQREALNGKNIMKVYAVIGGAYYHGESFYSLKLFDCWSTADAYREHLIVNEGFDYARMEEREVNIESAIKL
jgi:hypothetical protein